MPGAAAHVDLCRSAPRRYRLPWRPVPRGRVDQHLTLCGGKSVDRFEDQGAGLSREQILLGCRPRDRFHRPVVRPSGMSRRQKARRIDDGAVRFGWHLDRSLLGASARPRDIDHDPRSQVRKLDRPSNRSRERSSVSHASCTTSSAIARFWTCASANRSMIPLHRSTRSVKTRSSRFRSAVRRPSSSRLISTGRAGSSPHDKGIADPCPARLARSATGRAMLRIQPFQANRVPHLSKSTESRHDTHSRQPAALGSSRRN